MIPRYTPLAFSELWSGDNRYRTWLEVELAGCEAMEKAGLVPKGTAGRIRKKKIRLIPARIDEIEATTRHDVIAFLTHVEELAGKDARWLHRGMTSSDVLDTSLAMLLRDAGTLLIERTDALIAALTRRAREHRKTPMIGRSHGIYAEPVTFGLVLAGHLAEIKRGRAHLVRATEEISVGKIAGAVGTYAHITPAIEKDALGKLGLAAETVSTQVVSRDRHALYFSMLALVASSIERLAINIRHWQRSEVGEAEEAFGSGQKGSSAMPHKRNPIGSENLVGLARMVRAAAIPAMENVALWHERDISHSSVERMIAPDATATLAFMLERATKLIDGLVVFPERMKENLAKTKELYASESVMLALVEKGMGRQDAYVLVQRNAMKTWRGEGTFRDNLKGDADIRKSLSEKAIEKLFHLDESLRHVPVILKRAGV